MEFWSFWGLEFWNSGTLEVSSSRFFENYWVKFANFWYYPLIFSWMPNGKWRMVNVNCLEMIKRCHSHEMNRKYVDNLSNTVKQTEGMNYITYILYRMTMNNTTSFSITHNHKNNNNINNNTPRHTGFLSMTLYNIHTGICKRNGTIYYTMYLCT